MTMRRVLMTTDTIGGVWHYALSLARALVPHDFRVDLATMGAGVSSAQRAAAGRVPGLRLFESHFRLEWQPDPWPDVERAGEWLAELVRQTRPDLVHFNHFSHGHLELGVPKLVVAHSDVLSWFRAVRGHAVGPEWANYARHVERGLRGADAVIAPTRAMLESARADYGPFMRATVIANGREDAGGSAAKEDFVLTCGRLWDDGKNVTAVDEAARDLPWPVYAAGAGGGALAHARWLGELDSTDLLLWMSRAAIFAAPVRYEPFGLSILEAASNGCALVLGDIPSLRENWLDAAVFVDPTEPAALREVLRELIANPALRGDLGGRARRRAQRFSPEAMGAGYAKVYDLLRSRTESVERIAT